MMKRHGAVVVIAVVVAGCSSDKPSPTGYEIRTPLYAQSGHNGQMDFNLGTFERRPRVFTPAHPGDPRRLTQRGKVRRFSV